MFASNALRGEIFSQSAMTGTSMTTRPPSKPMPCARRLANERPRLA